MANKWIYFGAGAVIGVAVTLAVVAIDAVRPAPTRHAPPIMAPKPAASAPKVSGPVMVESLPNELHSGNYFPLGERTAVESVKMSEELLGAIPFAKDNGTPLHMVLFAQAKMGHLGPLYAFDSFRNFRWRAAGEIALFTYENGDYFFRVARENGSMPACIQTLSVIKRGMGEFIAKWFPGIDAKALPSNCLIICEHPWREVKAADVPESPVGNRYFLWFSEEK